MGLTGIVAYEPSELVVTVRRHAAGRAGAALAAQRQCPPSQPPLL